MKTINGFTCFFGADDPLSNWHPCSFKMGKAAVQFNCAEQAMMYYKAKLFGDNATAQDILDARTPKEQKRLGRLVKGFDEDVWVEKREPIMEAILYSKFRQNEPLKQALMATAGTRLVEASPYDRIWGAGLAADSHNIDKPDNWPGLNLLGRAMEKTREKMTEQESMAMNNSQPLYAIGLKGEPASVGFISGPFKEFPYADFHQGETVYRLQEGLEPVLMALDADGKPCAAITERKLMEEAVGHDFDDLVPSYIGSRFEITEKIVEAIASEKPLSSREQVASLIKHIDELVLEYAHDMRYEPDQHNEVVGLAQGWSVLRQQVWQTIGRPLQSKPSVAVRETPSAPTLTSPATAADTNLSSEPEAMIEPELKSLIERTLANARAKQEATSTAAPAAPAVSAQETQQAAPAPVRRFNFGSKPRG